ncbi:MAG: PAS domain-containing sensor histidine kinase [Alphaproteobacteria bacterium]|nr:MAG: PAS domain-containing sensor histidine kinase [Alphaproteobacteria bacterium]
MNAGAEALWSALPMPAVLLDHEDRIADVNPAGEHFLNASRRVLIGRPFLTSVAAEPPLDGELARARQRGSPVFVNEAAVGSDARRPVHTALQIAPFTDGSGKVLVLMTPQELAERLGQAGAPRSAARTAIGMADMLAHEIKNPLAGITGAAQLLAMNLSPGDRELTDLIVAEAMRVRDLLARVEAVGNMPPPSLGPVNVHDVMHRARRSAEVGFAAHMTLVEEYDPSLPLALADADQLLQAVLNLVKNAAEAQPQGGTIRLRTRYDPAIRVRGAAGEGLPAPLQIEVIDDGPGLPPDLVEAAFDPFVSGRENGTGLGLALVARIVSDHGGLVGVETAPGHTVFRIALRRAGPEQATSEEM